jgi:hypothetical protein
VSVPYRTLLMTATFLEAFADRDFSASDRARFLRALALLDTNEQHPSLRVHQLQGDRAGIWSASASDVLRLTFLRAEGGTKVLLTCSRHYDR